MVIITTQRKLATKEHLGQRDGQQVSDTVSGRPRLQHKTDLDGGKCSMAYILLGVTRHNSGKSVIIEISPYQNKYSTKQQAAFTIINLHPGNYPARLAPSVLSALQPKANRCSDDTTLKYMSRFLHT